MRQWTRSVLVQIMACRPFGAKPLSNQMLCFVNWTLRYKFQWNLNLNTNFLIHENASENIICEMAAILSRVGRGRVNYVAEHIKAWGEWPVFCNEISKSIIDIKLTAFLSPESNLLWYSAFGLGNNLAMIRRQHSLWWHTWTTYWCVTSSWCPAQHKLFSIAIDSTTEKYLFPGLSFIWLSRTNSPTCIE